MLNRTLYELLPFLYLTLAIILIVSLDQAARWIPAAFFALCGIMVLRWRYQERKQNKAANESSAS